MEVYYGSIDSQFEFDKRLERDWKMTEYRITKYNPTNRSEGIYMANEWTSFSDIGKVFGGTQLSEDVYLKTEQAYINCCMELIAKAQISTLSVEQAEYYAEGVLFPASISEDEEIRQVIKACLREQCWMKLVAEGFFVHFGYDYYMYIGSTLVAEDVEKIAAHNGLYCEQCQSPYRS